MDTEVLTNYGWIVVVLMVGMALLLFATPVSEVLYDEMTYTAVGQIFLNNYEGEETSVPTLQQNTITYELNGGKWDGSYATMYVEGIALTLPSNLSKDGYYFAGWYTNAACTSSFAGITESTRGSLKLYAKWIAQ